MEALAKRPLSPRERGFKSFARASMDIKDPVVGIVFNNKGLMYNLTLEGSKFSKIDR
jgi:hypothetical protein